jgi:AraC-like DNA-binding protein
MSEGKLKARRSVRAKSASTETGATVAAGFVCGLIAGMKRAGLAPAPLLAATGIPPQLADHPDSTERVPVTAYAALYNRVAKVLDDEAFGLFSVPMRCGSFEFLAHALIDARTLDEALTRMANYLHVLLPDLAVRIERQGSQAWLHVRETRPLAPARDDPGRVFSFEWLLRLIHGVACWLAGRGLALDRVDFPYPPPPHAADYALIYTAHSGFDAEELSARFQANLLDLPVQRDKAALDAFLIGAPGRITTLYRRDRNTVLAVRDLLRDALPSLPGLDEVAGRLHLSPRSLHRRLADEGANFRQIKDALRRDIALTRLATTDSAVATIAAELGYTDPSAFYRACVEWTGSAPSAYRTRVSAQAA